MAISACPHTCFSTELEREIKRQQKTFTLKENGKGSVHPLVSGAQSAFLPAPLSHSGVQNRTAKQLQENLVWLKLVFLKT